MKDVIVLEFNEVNADVLRRLAGRGELPHFKRLLENHALVRTTVSEDYAKLEPWIQWVTAHTGKSQAQHKAFNLSDVQHTRLRQVWDTLEARGIACGLVSPMNARRGELKKGFFIPDPWSVSKDTYPEALHPLYRFLMERVQSHNVSLERGGSKLSFALACVKAGVPLAALARLGAAYVRARIDKRNKWKLAAQLDRFLFELTLALRKRHRTAYTAVFMNAVAHYQHHYWTHHDPAYWGVRFPILFGKRNPVSQANLHPADDPMTYGLRTYDAVLGKAIDAAGVDSVMVVTGLSQVPFEGYEEGSGFYLYRPYDHQRLFSALGVQTTRISPLMSRDAMLYFADDEARDKACRILNSARVLGKPLFLCTEESDSRLFCKVSYSYDAPDDAVVDADGVTPGSMRFSDFFLLITFKTGHHCPEGIIIASRTAFAQSSPPANMTLEAVPELIFRAMQLDDHEQMAQNLTFSPA